MLLSVKQGFDHWVFSLGLLTIADEPIPLFAGFNRWFH